MVAEVKNLHGLSGEIEQMQSVYRQQREAFALHPYPSAEERLDQLTRLKEMLLAHVDEICAAATADFGNRSIDETKIMEIITSLEGLKYNAKNVRRWMKPQRRAIGALQFPARAWVAYQPLGVVGVIAPWNYPLFLAIGPLVAALAAGNRVMIKMSEFTPHMGALLKTMLAKYFSEDQIAVINGEADVAAAFSSLPFDHLLFTGSTSIGRHVMRAAAENLTPVTLELGGKSPTIIADSYPMAEAASRIAFGKCYNAGQTCVATDYVLCPESRVDELVQAMTDQVSQMYPTIRNNPDYTSIINERQYSRLQKVLADAKEKGARIVEINPANEDMGDTRKIPLTLVFDVRDDMLIASEEIFGPLMPVVGYKTLKDAVQHVNDRPRPLALYYFDYNDQNCQYVLNNTHSGGVSLNDTISHVGVDDMAFGGIGPSGMGSYHGHEGFLTFSHAKSVLRKGRLNFLKASLPPFGRGIHNFIYKLTLK
ncbi:MAG: coniferyl aldehyde dehydrogenase [Gammaproteobacteria bacterium]|nr:coniferyl aldehyde dehydrogenase [Gammaproteobacteria bacterium]MBQ0774214.1 coniferyl aldehyde dehydrogenase [Gammaproteobacteria bacterium]